MMFILIFIESFSIHFIRNLFSVLIPIVFKFIRNKNSKSNEIERMIYITYEICVNF